MVSFLVASACTIVFVFLFRRAIKKVPLAFYALAIVMDVVFVAVDPSRLSRAAALLFSTPMQRCTFALVLFAIVMFVGALSRESKIRACIVPVRGELSIMAALLAAGHIARYAVSYFGRLLDGSSAVASNMYVAFALAAALVLMLAMLTTTSFRRIKGSMSSSLWKNVQRWAYPFFGLVYVHATVALLPSAMHGARASIEMVGLYTALFGLYAVFRVRRMVVDRSEGRRSGAAGTEDPANAVDPAVPADSAKATLSVSR